MAALSCADGEEGRRSVRPPSAIPESVQITAAHVQIGTANGTLRRQVAVGGFSIGRFPVTVAQYRECVASRGCSPPALHQGACAGTTPGSGGPTWAEAPSDRDEVPVTCVSVSQAASYCRWVGGRLPAIEEWLHAARGPSVRPYPWGSEPPTCEQHAPGAMAIGGKAACCPGECALRDLIGVGRHPAGKSPSGVEDLLLTRAELVASSPEASVPGCRNGNHGCIVQSATPGSIDAVFPVPSDESAAQAWSFRCAWE
ncbi:MAG: SUMF1/EgtB/PvdO family nonheme iron enzyme [Myxococcales bacterium]|nr:SUMF1/EgtB/PvdO family nonheme iron enzyme [Myxococcales bacterium]